MTHENKLPRARVKDPQAAAARLPRLLEQYLAECREEKSRSAVFPNLAGFCRWLGIGLGEFEGLRLSEPRIFDRICTALEDEAWNSAGSATLIGTYIKTRLCREAGESKNDPMTTGQLRLIFEHDMREDGQ